MNYSANETEKGCGKTRQNMQYVHSATAGICLLKRTTEQDESSPKPMETRAEWYIRKNSPEEWYGLLFFMMRHILNPLLVFSVVFIAFNKPKCDDVPIATEVRFCSSLRKPRKDSHFWWVGYFLLLLRSAFWRMFLLSSVACLSCVYDQYTRRDTYININWAKVFYGVPMLLQPTLSFMRTAIWNMLTQVEAQNGIETFCTSAWLGKCKVVVLARVRPVVSRSTI